jgi:ubiquinone/menaquinone biosynthesis C-methylase UbiE
MGLIFDIHSARLYDSWRRSSRGRAMDSFLERLIPEMLRPRQNESVLDIGCGSGNHLLLLNRFGLDINGVDASPYMIDIAVKRLGNRCILKTGNARDLPFDDNEFDLAVLINTLEFLDDPLQALREAGRVAKRKVFIVLINSLSCYSLYDKLQSIFMDTISRYMQSYHLWELRAFIRTAFGQVPIVWETESSFPGFLNQTGVFRRKSWKLSSWPFGPFLGLSVTIDYTLKTDNLPLKIGVKKPEQPAASGITTMGRIRKQ